VEGSVRWEVRVVDVIVARCAGLDVHKNTVMACVRTPGPEGGRSTRVRRFHTFTSGLRELRDWLVAEGVTQAAMEATGVYWKPIWHVLDGAEGLELLLVNAHAVKNMPGRKTDVGDAQWLAQLCECGLLRPSFVPAPEQARLRDLTRYRKKLIEERTRETQRIQKLLEDAGIKLDSVVSDILGVSARRMLQALIAGVRDPQALAGLAHTSMQAKIPQLRRALEGRFGAHHALMLGMHLQHVDQLGAAIGRLDEEIDAVIRPFQTALRHLITIPGVGRRTAEVFLAEAGADMGRFPTAGHLASWAGMCPGNHESGGKRRSGRARKGNRALRAALCEAAWSAARGKSGYLGAQYRHLLRTFGSKGQTRAVFAVGHSIVIIAWHLLARDCDYQDLGAEHFTRGQDPQARQRWLIRQLEALGNTVTVEPNAA
jgi:transposase